MAEAFDRVPPLGPYELSITSRDAVAWLPPGGADKLRMLRQHVADLTP